ncbi:hypothetical protein BHM03_00019360 [Ensete ventricosum]|nr:hypothetical protein BHM03_00019360 [Ensete ventricosum]
MKSVVIASAMWITTREEHVSSPSSSPLDLVFQGYAISLGFPTPSPSAWLGGAHCNAQVARLDSTEVEN